MKGKPFLGMISGFFFGIFGGLTLFLFGVIPLDSHLLWILPIVGIVLGLLMATWAPFGKGVPETASPSTSAPAPAPAPEPTPPPFDDTVVDADPPAEPAAE
jgi:hypothetical protein